MNVYRLRHPWLFQYGLFILIALTLTGCSSRRAASPAVTLPATLPAAIPVDISPLTEMFEEMAEEYAAQYRVQPRPAERAIDAAEAYLRRHQPGPLPRIFQTTTLYDRNGTLLAELHEEGYRTWVPLEQISPHVIDAVIATEDSTFYTNPGYDARRVLAAFVQNTEAGDIVSGASTITMQLARHLFFTTEQRVEQTIERKVFEALLAQDLTAIFSKDEILEMYLNLVHFGRTAYGIEAAAQMYFGKPALHLTPSEATLLAGIPQQPGDYDPIANLELVRQRQRVVLDLMVRHRFLTAEEADRIYADVPVVQPPKATPPVLAPHFVQYLLNDIGSKLGGMDARRSGLKIVTTLDLRMQDLAQEIVATQVEQLKPRFDLSNAALVAMRPGTAEVLAMVGSADFTNPDIDGQVNVAVSLRQPGSAIKPVLYATAVHDGMISPASVLWDIQVEYDISRTDRYRPQNYDNRYHGPVTVRTALANSYNVPAVKLLDAVGVERMLESARAMGIGSLTRDTSWYGLSLTLGGGEVTLLDLTTAYHTIANGGVMLKPRSILIASGHVPGIAGLQLLTGMTSRGEQVISKEAAYLITDILSDNAARTPAFGENSVLRLSRPAAAKTGTTTDWRDNWTMGYTRYLVAGVWAGNSDGRPMRNASGVTGAAPIWNAFMEAVLEDEQLLAMLGAPAEEEGWAFTPPAEVQRVAIECPSRLTCPEEEVFAASWLAAEGMDSPVADSMGLGSMRSVYINRGRGNRNVGACSEVAEGFTVEGGRVLLRMPYGVGRERMLQTVNLPLIQEEIEAQENEAEANASTQPRLSTRAERISREQQAILDWSLRNGSTLYWGTCDEVERLARSVYPEGSLAISISGFDEIVASDRDEDDDSSGEISERIAAAPGFVTASSGRYEMLGAAHNSSCSGPSVMGQVYNASGQPVAGITVVYEDQFGNRSTARTSGNPGDYGSYRFAIPDDSPQQITIMLFDDSGAQVGSGALVGHKMGGPTDQPCHYVHWGGTN